MRAAILTRVGFPLEVDDVEPLPLEYGQVLVKVLCASICGRQLGEITGSKGYDPYLPHLMGHEGCGEVLEIGPGVSHVSSGDRVVMHWRKGSGIEAKPPKYRWKDKMIGGGPVTTFSEQSVVSENRLTKVPKDTPTWLASLLGCALTTGIGLVGNEAKLRIGESVAVMGCGGVGLSVVMAASMMSAYPIVATDTKQPRLDLAMRLGATHTILSNPAINWSSLREISGKYGVDLVVECTGVPEMINGGYSLTAPGGRMVLVGQPPAGDSVTFYDFANNYKGKRVFDSQGGLTIPEIDIPRYVALYKLGRMPLAELLVGPTAPLESINQAIALAKEGTAGRIMLGMPNGHFKGIPGHDYSEELRINEAQDREQA
jgi:S-(hydroxymethyl)glutathione dehydrogenase / alcohol dehydrogenase